MWSSRTLMPPTERMAGWPRERSRPVWQLVRGGELLAELVVVKTPGGDRVMSPSQIGKTTRNSLARFCRR
jgi:hypothetical protein